MFSLHLERWNLWKVLHTSRERGDITSCCATSPQNNMLKGEAHTHTHRMAKPLSLLDERNICYPPSFSAGTGTHRTNEHAHTRQREGLTATFSIRQHRRTACNFTGVCY
uniref:Uncharacterized protein n=1 Tax=Trypanosoma vivax (strain Y486) TaxID=1055687 RepID=G0TY66_TRYVY|nr:hypothetical protein, unlikely [Trypanosoma vivax Y486]